MGSRYKIMADKIGISSACFYPLDTIESLRQCVKGGFTSAEIFINTYSEMSGEYYKEMKAYIDGAGLEIVSIHPFTSGYENVIFFTGYDRRIEDGIEFYKTYFDFAARLGAKFVVFHGNNMKTKFCGFEKYAEIFTRINECAHTFGVELIHENTTWCVAREAAGITELRRACPDMKFVFDAKQSCRGGYDPYAALEAMEHLVGQGMPFEINCGAHNRGRKAELYPRRSLLRALHDFGGEILISSDAHQAACLNGSFDVAVERARACGFTHVNVLAHDVAGNVEMRQLALDVL